MAVRPRTGLRSDAASTNGATLYRGPINHVDGNDINGNRSTPLKLLASLASPTRFELVAGTGNAGKQGISDEVEPPVDGTKSLNTSADVDRSESGDRNADPVECAIAASLTEATKSGQWDLVAQLARELQARREARSAPNVVHLPIARRS